MHWPPSVGPAGSDLELPPDAALTGVGLQGVTTGAEGGATAGRTGEGDSGEVGDKDGDGDTGGDGTDREGAGDAARNRRPPAELLVP